MNIEGFSPLLNVEDVARSVAFYQDHLGFRVVKEWSDAGRVRWASLEAHGIRLMLNEPDDVDSQLRRKRPPYADVVFYFTIDDVDPFHAQLTDAGVAVSSLSDEHYGLREFYVRDPDGYELGFGSHVAAPEATP